MRDDEWNDPDSGTPVGHDRRPGHDRRRRGNGAHNNGTYRRNGGHHELPVRPLPVDDADEPIDLVAVQADDELLSALASGLTVTSPGRAGYDTDDKLVAMLAAWREEVDADPVPRLVDTDTAVAAVTSARQRGSTPAGSGTRERRGGRLRLLAPVAAAACMVVLSTGAVAAANVDDPEDLAFPIVKVVDSEKAESIEASADIKKRIQRVQTALAVGDTGAAAREMQQIESQLPKVDEEQGQTQLASQQKLLEAELQAAQPGVAVDPAAPGSTTTSPDPSTTVGGTDPAATSAGSQAPLLPGSGAPVTSGPERTDVTTPGPSSPLPSAPVGGPGSDPRSLRTTDGPDPSTSAPNSPSSPAPGPRPDPTGPAGPTDPDAGQGAPGPTSPAGVPPAAPPDGAPGGTAGAPTDGPADAGTTTAAGSAGASEQVSVTTTTG